MLFCMGLQDCSLASISNTARDLLLSHHDERGTDQLFTLIQISSVGVPKADFLAA
jgi:hypothetical protein